MAIYELDFEKKELIKDALLNGVHASVTRDKNRKGVWRFKAKLMILNELFKIESSSKYPTVTECGVLSGMTDSVSYKQYVHDWLTNFFFVKDLVSDISDEVIDGKLYSCPMKIEYYQDSMGIWMCRQSLGSSRIFEGIAERHIDQQEYYSELTPTEYYNALFYCYLNSDCKKIDLIKMDNGYYAFEKEDWVYKICENSLNITTRKEGRLLSFYVKKPLIFKTGESAYITLDAKAI